MLVGLTASAKPLDEDTIVTLLGAGFSDADIAKKIREEGYSGPKEPETLKMLREAGAGVDLILAVKEGRSPNSYSTLETLGRLEAAKLGISDRSKEKAFVADFIAQNTFTVLNLETIALVEARNLGITDQDKIETFVADYIAHNTVAADFTAKNTVKDNPDQPAEPDFYAENPNTPRVQIVKREGKYGLKLKGKVVVEPEWDDWDSKFDPDGSGTFTFSKFSKVGLAILDDLIAKKLGMYEMGTIEAANLGITDEKERRTFLRGYLMNRQPENKIKWFDKSVTYEMPASDDPLALIEYERGSGLKRRDGSVFIPGAAEREDFEFSLMFYLPAESVGDAGKGSAVTPAPLPDSELKELTGIYYVNFLRTLGNMGKLSPNVKNEPKVFMDLIDDDAIAGLLGAKSQAYFKNWAQEERDTTFLFLVLVEQLDSTWKAELRAEVKEASAN